MMKPYHKVSKLMCSSSSGSSSSSISDISNSSNNRIILPSNQKKYNSEIIIPQVYSSDELLLVSKTSFSTNDYFNDILKSNNNNDDNDINRLFLIAIPSVLTAAFIVPMLSLPDMIKNTLGLGFLFLPFILILISILSPNLLVELRKNDASKKQGLTQQERILYHEAGHLLVGYLCGIPITDYSINGDRDAGTSIDFNSIITINNRKANEYSKNDEIPFARATTMKLNENNNNNDKLGAILVMACSGMVSETLRHGLPSFGGREDIAMAFFMLNKRKVAYEDQEGVLRWALAKSLTILNKNRDLLDLIVDKMKVNTPILQLFEIIENN